MCATAGKGGAVSCMDAQTDSKGPQGKLCSGCSRNDLRKPDCSSASTGGTSVGGCYLFKMLARGGDNSITTCSSSDSHLHTAQCQQGSQQQGQQQGAGDHASEDSPCTSSEWQQRQPILPADVTSQGEHTADHGEHDVDNAAGVSDSSIEAAPCFESWLMAAEQHSKKAVTCSSMLVACDTGDVSSWHSSSDSSSRQQPNVAKEDCRAIRDDKPATNTAATMNEMLTGYQRQLQAVLLQLEGLEVKQSSVAAARSVSDEPHQAAVVKQGSSAAGQGIVHFTSGMRLPDAVHVPEA